MKVNLVVASGAHQGRVIPMTGSQFLIGRDAQCNMRPASQAISKRHCGVLVRDGNVYVKDFGSTNGTTVNNELLKDAEVLVIDGASLKVGPLDFTIRIEQTAVQDGTPLPANTPESAAALAAVKAVSGTIPKTPPRDTTPNPAKPARPAGTPGSKEIPALTGSKEAAALKGAAPAKPAARPAQPAAPSDDSPPGAAGSGDEEHDRLAAMLLGMEDDGTSEVPDGSTVMDVPAALTGDQAGAAKPEDKKKLAQTREEMSSAASEILRKMMRRPK